VIAVPCAAAKEAVHALAPGGPLRELGAAVALFDLAAKDPGMPLLTEIRPDFVRLTPSFGHHVPMVGGVPGKAMNVRAVRAVAESGTQVIAAGISTPAERAACLEAGCTLGQGPLFEERKRADVPSRKANLGGLPAAEDAFYMSLALDSIERS
jgi:EAL domain-containing protein (putative c-di-GMP-specific phosphodiesterase class I)